MKVLHVIESDGGSTDFIYLLAKYLPDIHHVALCGNRAWKYFGDLKNQLDEHFPVNLDIVYWPSAERELNPFKDFKGILHLTKLMKQYADVDVVHLHSSKAGFLGRLVAWRLGMKKVVYTTHAVAFLRKDVSTINKKQYIFMEKLASWFGGSIVCCSESESAEMSKYGFVTIAITNGVVVKGEMKEQVPINLSEEVVVAGIGRLTPQKNPQMFNEIASKFIDNNKVRFLWVGKGELEHEITSSNIEITGWLDKETLQHQLIQIDICVSTALWEGMPLAVLESMAMGKPLVLSRCVGNIDLVEEGRNGYLFDNIDQAVAIINQLCEDKSKRMLMGRNSRQLCVEKYDISLTAQRYSELYSTIGIM